MILASLEALELGLLGDNPASLLCFEPGDFAEVGETSVGLWGGDMVAVTWLTLECAVPPVTNPAETVEDRFSPSNPLPYFLASLCLLKFLDSSDL
jgi:hypothetical protein